MYYSIKKIIILAGGSDQAAFINKLRRRFIGCEILLIDYASNVLASKYADKHIIASTLDKEAVLEIARNEKVDIVLTACGDQTLPTMSYVSEELGLPCYLTYKQSLNLTNKLYMKNLMIKNDIPTSNFMKFNSYNKLEDIALSFPLVVKPVDNNGSKGIIKVFSKEDIENAINKAQTYSKTEDIIIEEFCDGQEYSVEAFIKEDGEPIIVLETELIKIEKNIDKFTILKCNYPCKFSDEIRSKIKIIIKNIGEVFGICNVPFMIQFIVNHNSIKVIEFSARTGGGSKYHMIKELSDIDIFDNLIDITLKHIPIVIPKSKNIYASFNYIYCKPGIFSGIVNFDYLKYQLIIDEYFFYKPIGSKIQKSDISSDRPVGFFITAASKEELNNKISYINQNIKVLDENNQDIIIHDLFSN
jgi:phosphoribosylamine-glycine ligase